MPRKFRHAMSGDPSGFFRWTDQRWCYPWAHSLRETCEQITNWATSGLIGRTLNGLRQHGHSPSYPLTSPKMPSAEEWS